VQILNLILIFASTEQDDVQLSKTSIANFKMKRMKKNVIVVGLLCLSLTTFISCNDKKKDKEDEETMSELTVEQHKTNLQNEGVALVDNMTAMENMSSIQIIQDFSNLEVAEEEMTAPVLKILSPLSAIKSNGASVLKLESLSEDPQTLSELFAEMAGVHTYNAETLDWDLEKETSTEITFKFPAGSSTTNNATISITNFDVMVSPNAETSPEELGELVKSLRVVISKNEVPQLSFEMSASYNGDGLPQNSNFAFTFAEGYIFSATTALTSKAASFDQSFTYKLKNLFSTHLDFDGSINYDNILAVNDENMGEQSVLNNSNAWISIGNIKLQGVINVKKLLPIIEKEEESEEDLTEASANTLATNLNDNIKLYMKYIDSNTIIAKCNFYAYEDEDEYFGNYWTVEPQALFSDNSAYDESFFKTGFSQLQSKLEDWADAMETNYGE